MNYPTKLDLCRLGICGLALAATVVAPAQTWDKISPEVHSRAQRGGMLPVFIVLSQQPHRDIIAQVHGSMSPRMRAAESDHYQLSRQPMASAAQLQQARARLDGIRAAMRLQSFQQIEAEIRPDQDRVEARLRAMGAKNVERYSILNMIRADVPASELAALEADPMVASISLVQKRVPHLTESVSFLWFGAAGRAIPQGSTGTGQTVAILDTGIKTDHPAFHDLQAVPGGIPGKAFLSHSQFNGNPAIPDPCFNDNAASAEDHDGHGTHVAGIVASRGGSNAGGRDWSAYKGVAPGAGLVNLKIGAKQHTEAEHAGCKGGATASDDDVLAAIQWTLSNPATASTDIFNYSFGSCQAENNDGDCTAFDDDDRISRILDSIADYWGLTLVISAGNEGVIARHHKAAPDCNPAPRTISSPGIGYNVFTVANIATIPRPAALNPPTCPPPPVLPAIWPTSSKGPTVGGRRKPDIAAPGTYIYSAAFNWQGSLQFVPKTGTSMAAPHIAGAVAVLQSRPDFRPSVSNDCLLVARAQYSLSVKALLLNSAAFVGNALDWTPDSGWGWASLSTATDHLGLSARPKAVLLGSCVTAPPQNPANDTPRSDIRFFKGPVQASAAIPFKATLAWNRHVDWNVVNRSPTETVWSLDPAPLAPLEPTHLRMQLYDAVTNARLDRDPVLAGDSRNNVRQIVSQHTGSQVIKVYREAGFGPVGQEFFSLAVSRPLEPATAPELGLSCIPGGAMNPGQSPILVCAITNNGELPLFNLVVRASTGGVCHRQDDAKPLDFQTSEICTMPSPGGIVNLAASGVFAGETFGASTTLSTPYPIDCHGVYLRPAKATIGPAGGTGSFDVVFPDPLKCSIRDVSTPLVNGTNAFGWIRLGAGSVLSTVLYTAEPLNPPPPPFLPPPPPNSPRTGFIEVLLRDYSHLAFQLDQTAGAAPPATNVTAQVAIAPGGFRLDRATGRFVQTIRLTNRGAAAIDGPLSLALDGLPAGVTLFNASGTTSAATPASPYLNAGGGLAIGAFVDVNAEFVNPTKGAIPYQGRVLSGSNR